MGLVKRTYVDGETVITADNLNDIQDAIIQNEEDISTKGTYSKPTGGIPKTDLASAVQTSLEKADTALQSSDIDNTLTVSGKAADAKKTGDEISDLKNTLNHKADVIYDTASGAIASFPDGADGLPVKDLTVAIEPVQSGTGDPSPTNVRPISGWTGCEVSRTGKNLYNLHLDKDSGAETDINCFIDRPFVISAVNNNVVVSEAIWRIQARFADGTSRYAFDSSYPYTVSIGTKFPTVVNASPENPVIQLEYRGNNIQSGSYDIMIAFGTEESAYEPYDGTTIPISWQSSAGTVYAASLDALAGSLKVRPYYASYNGETLVGPWISSMDAYTPGGTPTTGAQVVDFGGSETLYSLDSIALNTLLGQNNIFTDCGPVSVEYPADTKLYIQKINTPTDDDMIADAQIASGKYFIVNNNLYLSTSAILAGDPIKPGTNCTLTNLAAALNAINS